eukprot:TRINITY_DN11021_c1_g1_i1.p1 TRINITY_DN11021_c1_g1~~TRINITY_DN11021_c1_g1_i1.p1  ORF type:complete len:394 (+),score=81.26 TRINITY_DN11021_c1_g1_i1:84-1184(+)
MTNNNNIAPEDKKRFEQTHFYQGDKAHAIEKKYRLRVVSGRANNNLANDVCKILQLDPTPGFELTQAANQELSINAGEVMGDDVYLIQPMAGGDQDLNTSVMEALLAVHSIRLQGAARITAIIPYLAYSRQDRKTKPRVPISASAMAQLIQCLGVDRVMTVDLHCGQIQGFFHNCPVDNLPVALEFSKYILNTICEKEEISKERTCTDITIVAPDASGVERARTLANMVNAKGVVTILKRRAMGSEPAKMEMVGDVEGQICVIIDDLVDTAGTLVSAANLVASKGGRSVYALITHGILTDPAAERVTKCDIIKELVITDSVDPAGAKSCCKIRTISIAPMLAEAIERTHSEVSLSAIFDNGPNGKA